MRHTLTAPPPATSSQPSRTPWLPLHTASGGFRFTYSGHDLISTGGRRTASNAAQRPVPTALGSEDGQDKRRQCLCHADRERLIEAGCIPPETYHIRNVILRGGIDSKGVMATIAAHDKQTASRGRRWPLKVGRAGCRRPRVPQRRLRPDARRSRACKDHRGGRLRRLGRAGSLGFDGNSAAGWRRAKRPDPALVCYRASASFRIATITAWMRVATANFRFAFST
jgi:hypothetical protein